MERLVNFSSARECPPWILRRLREVDSSAELVHMGGPTWLLGRVRPTTERRRIAINMLDQEFGMLSVQRQMHPRTKGRVTLAILALQGFAPVAEYRIIGEPGGQIVEDFRRALWMLHNTSDDELWKQMDEDKEKERTDARAELMDMARHKDAWRYAFTRSHTVTRFDDPASVYRPKSGRTLHKVLKS